MGVLDYLKDVVTNLFDVNSEWVIRTSTSSLDIEKCNGEAVADEATHTCELCVALNRTIFKNKPTYHHPNCRCVNKPTNLTSVVLDFPMKKITKYLFVNQNKAAMMHSMGYYMEDSDEVYDLVSKYVSTEFLKGNYVLRLLDTHGQHFQIDFTLNGKRDHIGESFKCYVGCVAWTNGKIKIATPVIQN